MKNYNEMIILTILDREIDDYRQVVQDLIKQ